VQRFQGKPFVLLGVNSDENVNDARLAIEKNGLNWRSWWNGPQGPSGPLAAAWNVEGWPSMFLIDSRGVIRYGPDQLRVKHSELTRMIEELVREAEKGA
jgi:hypothetical protein